MITQEELVKLVQEYPNDMELGSKVRQLYFKFKQDE